MLRILFTVFVLIFASPVIFAQEQKLPLLSFKSADSLDKKRVKSMTILGTGCYAGMFGLLSKAWYSKYDQTSFHLFNDNREWLQMDKVGHVFGGYFESRWFSQAYQWAGVKQRKSVYCGVLAGTVIQGTLEFSDGFSKKWGFSLGDITANTTGTALFLGQELAWKEQRICMKVSNTPKKYPNDLIISDDGLYSVSLKDRAHNLLGDNYIVSFLKDYNAQTIWLSGNIHSFFPNSNTPKWLNVAVGYGAENLYVGDNKYFWTQKQSNGNVSTFSFDAKKFPRYRQVFLSFDVDLTRIKTKSHFWNTVLHGFNIIKIPAPALEFNGLGKVRFHPIYF